MIKTFLALLASAVALISAQECITPECTVYAPQQGFEVRKLAPHCLVPHEHHHHHHHHKAVERHSSSSSSSYEHNPLCSAYYTAKPQACGPYTLLEEIPSKLVNYLNSRDFLGVGTLYDVFGLRVLLVEEEVTLEGVCKIIEFYKQIIDSPTGTFWVEVNTVIQNDNVGYIQASWTYQEGNNLPVYWSSESTLIRDACNNWVYTLETLTSLVGKKNQ